MILSAIVLIGIAALVGLMIIFIGVRYRKGYLALGLGHAGLASTGLIVLVVAILRAPNHHLLYNNAALLFVLTLLGGLVLLALREGRKPPPLIVVSIHAAMAVFALYLLVKGYFLY
ncbi:MAG: hypothetical protein GC149_02650 [Gammaproteobacteria bacterium]|nr:hypothetical protein [Gammaproteobacteria bacterium]